MIRPINDKILIRKIEQEQKTAGGIILTQKQDRFARAEVVAVSDQVRDITVGNIVVYPDGLGNAVRLDDGSDGLLLEAPHCVAVIEE